MTDPLRIAFIGLGQMGSAIAANILKAGYPLTVYNRTAERAADLVKQGAVLADSPAAAAQHADVVFTMLSDDAATEAVVWGENGILSALPKEAIHLAMSTISVSLSEKLSGAHSAAGQHFIASPVLGRPEMAALGKLFIVAAGPQAARDRVRPLLQQLGQQVFDVADNAAASSLLKLIANFMITTVIESLSEASALAQKNGLDPATLLEVLTGSLFNAPIYKTYGGLIVDQKFEPAGFTVPLGQKDNRLVLQAAEQSQVPMPMASLIRDRMLAARAKGWDHLDWSATSLLALEDAGIGVEPRK